MEAGAHILAVKDMAGLLRPASVFVLVDALRKRFDLPVHLHTHDTTGGQTATLLAAAEAGVDAVDVANSAMAGTTSQPPMSALIAAMEYTARQTEIPLEAALDLEPYWEAVRSCTARSSPAFRAPPGACTATRFPAVRLSNLRQQAISLGLADKFEQIEDMYAAADRMLGRLVKVTPSSKVVGDLALNLVAGGVDPGEFERNPQDQDLPDSVIGFLQGEPG
ncbi:hypothetical protein GCM10025876_38110 [Demequina litorisediminis]|uniref:Pyruvate carboxyltransferase domain-containing protein n=1 Tax=Demequina litorisediminis TaxID=1849022 RepID=A0ABQ6IKC4_9MICO|nr:hypothetical protein GCM10025876_38110 [Demequina litorisediminis]